tara:strand:+ start:1097 stop:1735 length:639 start_codon:yes stop_codon:yes gene_type:complete
MAKQVINIGTVANDSTGDPLRTAFDKVNDNFTELYDDDTGDVRGVLGTAPIAATVASNVATVSLNNLGVTSGKLAANSVITDKITDLNVTTAKLANDSVTFDKLGVEYTASTPLTSAATIAVNTALSDVFTFTAGHSATLDFTNVGIGDLKSFVITGGGGSYTLSFGDSNGSSAIYNKISGTFLDTASAKNLVQIKFVAVNEAWYSISQIAS